MRKAEEKNPVGKEGWQDRMAGGLLETVAGKDSRKMVCKQHVAGMKGEGGSFVQTRNYGCNNVPGKTVSGKLQGSEIRAEVKEDCH